jgi:hypothetical protein
MVRRVRVRSRVVCAHKIPEKQEMLEEPPAGSPEDVESIARRGPRGALAVCVIAVAVVIAIWFAFYFFAFLPRGFTQ